MHILDEDGNEIEEPRVEGGDLLRVAADAKLRFRYYKDDEEDGAAHIAAVSSRSATSATWTKTAILYLTDRKSNMIISGGVNIYPQEVESHARHASEGRRRGGDRRAERRDGRGGESGGGAARLGDAGPELAAQLIEFCRGAIAHYKCPRTIDFVDELPRTENGKLLEAEAA